MNDLSHALSPDSNTLLRHYRGQVLTRRIYSVLIVLGVLFALGAAMNFANAANSGKFFERIPFMFDFLKNFVPNDPVEIIRAMFDLESPYSMAHRNTTTPPNVST
jgi:phosphonate transport system permease protein